MTSLSSSDEDEEGEFLPNCINDYVFVDQSDGHVSLACLPLLWQKDEFIGGVSMRVFVSGSCDHGLQKIYKEVVAWSFELSYVQPEISVLCKGRGWMKLLKPRRMYELTIRSVLITVHCLHFVKHNLEATEESLCTHLSRVFSYYDDPPALHDCMKHVTVIKDAADHDPRLKDSELIQKMLSGQPMQRNVEQVEGMPKEAEFIVHDEDTDDPSEDDEIDDFFEEEEDLFDACCSLCDNGGDMLFCEGRCMRSFHVRRQTGDLGEETCEGLGLSEAQVKSMPQFFCQNCQYQKHQCSICGKLGSSDLTSNAEVFSCIAGSCGRFYHPACVSKEFQQRNETQIENLEESITAGDSFVCPVHKCFSCKQIENIKIPEMQFAVCRRCPKAYHRKCLPREIMFATEEKTGILPRAWDGLLPKRILMYCMDHEIVPELGTPLRNHICFPRRLKVKIHTSQKTVIGVHKKDTVDHTSLMREPAIINIKKEAASEFPRVVDKHICGPSFDSHTKDSFNNPINASAHLKKLPRREHTEDKSVNILNMLPKREDAQHASNVYLSGPSMRRPEEKKVSPMKRGNPNLYGDNSNALHSAKPLTKKQGPSTPVTDFEMERRMAALIEEVDSSFDADEFLKQKKLTSMYVLNSKDMIEKNLTKGQVEAAVKAIREADQILSRGGSVEDAKAACSVQLIRQVPLWKKKLRGCLSPFLHGMHFSSYGRHFTKTEKLQEIVNRLHNYVQDGDMIVDFCCGSNEFSSLMKEKLDSVGKTKCSFKNFDMFPSQNDFNFELRDWFSVEPNELPLPGSRLVMGLNPPFGFNAALANKFIDHALKFKPKLLILIVPPETKRLDSWNSKRGNIRYDLLWEDQNLLAGESFYLPGAFDKNAKNISQWNNTTPPLYLWSRPDWTREQRDIAIRCGHSPPLVAPEE